MKFSARIRAQCENITKNNNLFDMTLCPKAVIKNKKTKIYKNSYISSSKGNENRSIKNN